MTAHQRPGAQTFDIPQEPSKPTIVDTKPCVITYYRTNDPNKTEYKITVDQHKEACFIHQSMEYCRPEWVVTSRWPGTNY